MRWALSIPNSERERALRDPSLWWTAVDANNVLRLHRTCVHAHASLMRGQPTERGASLGVRGTVFIFLQWVGVQKSQL
jgi:hypothetical protein